MNYMSIQLTFTNRHNLYVIKVIKTLFIEVLLKSPQHLL